MKERPILFSGAMVRALLAGTKTQTRRPVKLPRSRDSFVLLNHGDEWMPGWWPYQSDDGESAICNDGNEHPYECPYGTTGDRLWVRETCRAEELASGLDGVRYIADNAFHEIENTEAAADAWINLNAYRGQRGAQVPSIHMPRWASRITLEIISVSVERLQDISKADAIAEGTPGGHGAIPGYPYNATPIEHYFYLWKQINGADSLHANPWVWVVEFKVIKP